ncbi:hypothetical protein NQ036_06730 [Brevibacterium sp. 91QC2O2]|uniref:hypothetical protein n=1 Tax=Brevibacterium sp. 91QC2O2 TaxID=2968458 RepID=UPI00211CE220|nr:hypothetical protein [Brevibacterium sp. 91QC2O2]MCQ9367938.1 hypothetical protein [Brevibacterium sp. 91QC2O2]
MTFETDFQPDRYDYPTSIHELAQHAHDWPDTPQDALIDGTIQLSYRPRQPRWIRGGHDLEGYDTALFAAHSGDHDGDRGLAWIDPADIDQVTRAAHKLIEQVTPAPGVPEVRQARGAIHDMEHHQVLADTARAERDTAIRAAHTAGMSMYRLAQELDMPQSTVRKIVNAA